MNDETESTEEFVRLLTQHTDQLRHESERGSVIVSAALMDEALENLIKAKLVASPESDDELFGGAYAPMGSFSAKIDFAYRLGLIRLSTRSSLHLIRKMRNDFAHSTLRETFESDRVKSRVSELFRLNQTLCDIIWQVVKEADLSEIGKTGRDFESNHSIDNLVAIAGWQGLFRILVSLVAISLKLAEVEPLTSKNNVRQNESGSTLDIGQPNKG